MKKFLIVFGAISVIFLMVSNATAVQQINSESIIKNISDNKQQITSLEEILKVYIDKVSDITYDTINIKSKGIIDTLITLLRFLIDLINTLIEFIIDFMQLGALILALISALKTLINLIMDFIEWLNGLFNPGITTAIQ